MTTDLITECHWCDGTGEVEIVAEAIASEWTGGLAEVSGVQPCAHCLGTGIEHDGVDD